MPSGNQQPNLIGENLYHLQPLLLDRQLSNAEVRQVVENGLHDPNPVRTIYQELYVGELLFKFRKHTRQDINASRLIGGYQELAPRDFFEFVNRVLRSSTQREDLLGMLSEDTSGDG